MEKTVEHAIRILDNAYQVVMSLVGNSEKELDKIQEILSGIDDVQNKIEDL
tara:strand:- start:380 stop:532 length:153 start_codon:yes stop_codon:yes gene_type:complete